MQFWRISLSKLNFQWTYFISIGSINKLNFTILILYSIDAHIVIKWKSILINYAIMFYCISFLININKYCIWNENWKPLMENTNTYRYLPEKRKKTNVLNVNCFFFLFAVPPERINIRDESNTERTQVVGPYSEGDTMKLKCDVLGGKPTPTVSWSRDGYPIVSDTDVGSGGRYLRSEIMLERLSRQDLNSRFTCKAINHPRATPVEASVQIDMNCEWHFVVFLLLYLFYQ